jgi:hypothetical protein
MLPQSPIHLSLQTLLILMDALMNAVKLRPVLQKPPDEVFIHVVTEVLEDFLWGTFFWNIFYFLEYFYFFEFV